MPHVDQKEFFRNLKTQVDNLYLLYGEERYLVDQSVNLIIEKALGKEKKEPNDFNLNIFYSDKDKETVISAINTLPFMSHKKVVVIKQIESCGYLDSLKKVIENLNPETVLVLVGYKIDQRKSFFKTATKLGQAVELNFLKEEALTDWMKKRFNINPDVSRNLISRVGRNMYTLKNEILKLVSYSDSEVIDVKALDDLTQQMSFESVFKISEYLVDKNRPEALKLLYQSLSDNSGVGILALISRHFRILLCLKESEGDTVVLRQFGIPNYFSRKYVEQSRLWSHERLLNVHNLILDTDLMLKSSSLPAEMHLTNLVIKAIS